MQKKLKRSVFPLLSIHFIGTMGLSIMLPFLVYLVKDVKGNDFIYGLLGSFYSLFQFVGAPLLGRMSDTIGRRKILLVSDVGTLLSWGIFLWAMFLPVQSLFSFDSPVTGLTLITLPVLVLFIARALDGLTGGNIAVANAYLADVSDEKTLKRNYGLMGAASSMGFIAGPLLAGILGDTRYGLKLPVLVTMGITLISILLIIFMLPDSKDLVSKEEDKEEKVAVEKKKPGIKFLLGLPNIPFLLALYFLIYMGFNIFYTAFPLFAVERMEWDVKQTGIFFAVLSGMMILVQGPILNWLSKKYSDENLVIAGSLILGTNFLLLMPGTNLMVYIAAAFFSAGNGIMWPSFLSVLAKNAPAKYQGAIQGLAGSSGSLSSIIGLVLGGVLYHALHAYAFLIAAGIIYFVFLLSFRLKKLSLQAVEK